MLTKEINHGWPCKARLLGVQILRIVAFKSVAENVAHHSEVNSVKAGQANSLIH